MRMGIAEMSAGWTVMAAAMLSTAVLAQEPDAKVKYGTPPLNRNRAEVMRFYEENVYGVRPDLKDFVKRAKVVAEEKAEALNATKKVWEINTMTPLGEKTFRAYGYFPKREGRAPVFVYLHFNDPEQEHARWPVKMILERGYATVSFCYNDVVKDDAKVFDGIERKPDSWGAISAWALAASRVVDVLVEEPAADAEKIAVVGLSRLGKTALWAGATDTRIAYTVSNCSGCLGARLTTRNVRGETIDQITGKFPHWFALTCRAQFAGKDASLPFDQHWLLGTIADRLLAVGSAEDDWWACPSGEMAAWELSRGQWDARQHKQNRTHYHFRRGGHDILPEDWADYMDFAASHDWK